MRFRRGFSEAIAVIILSLVLTVGVFIVFAVGLQGISRTSRTHSEDVLVQLVDIAVNTSSCSINVTLLFTEPTNVQRITLVLDNNITVVHDFGFGQTVYGLYIENTSACHRPVAIVITTVDGKNLVLKP